MGLVLLALSAMRVSATDVIIHEILYHPDPDNAGGEFIELFHRGENAVDLSGWGVEDAVTFEFPAATTLEPGSYLVLARTPAEARAFYGLREDQVLGPYSGRLDNAGETISLRDAGGELLDSVSYDDTLPWPPEADGGGPSLELFATGDDNAEAASWGLGQSYSPGAANAPAPAGGGDVVIHEIHYKPLRQELREKFDAVNRGFYFETDDDAFGEYVELFHRGTEPVDLAGWQFSEGIDFLFPEGSTLDPGEVLAICSAPEVMKLRYGIENVVGPFQGSLRNSGERVTLRDADSLVVDTVRYDDRSPWPAAADQLGVSLECVDPFADNSSARNWRSSREDLPLAQPVLDPLPDGGDGWERFEATGVVRGSRLEVFVSHAGEWLLDAVEVRLEGGGPNLIVDGSFESGDESWSKRGNHADSFWTQEDARDGVSSEHIVATGAGASRHRLETTLEGVQRGASYEVSAWVKHLAGSPRLRLRFGVSLQAEVRVAETSYDLAADWSDARNENGSWSYHDASGDLLSGQTPAWLESVLGPGQPAWIDGETAAPGWCRSAGTAPLVDFPAGRVGTHGPSELRWVSPGSGLVTLAGGLYLIRHGHDQVWEIRHNETLVASGRLIAGALQHDSSNPLRFSSGTTDGGPLTRVVADGDVLRWIVSASDDGPGELVGWDVAIAYRSAEARPAPVSGAQGRGTPGRRNSVLDAAVPPFVDRLEHTPAQPRSTDAVTMTVRVTSDRAPLDVVLEREVLTGATREPLAAEEMFDDGAHGDGAPGDGVYGVVVPAQPSRTLVHYRVRVEDGDGRVTIFPYGDDPAPSRAYVHFDDEIDTRLTTYHLFVAPENLAQLNRTSSRDTYFDASLAVVDRRVGKEDGAVAYPHVGVRHRGRRSRTDPRHQWKFRFNRGQLYDGHRVLDTMLSIPLVQKMAFDVFERAGIANLESDVVRLYLNGELWEVYIVFEVPNATWLAKHGYPGGSEVYKARTVETPGETKNSDLYRNQIVTDHDFWGAWNKKVRPLEPPDEIRELTDRLNDAPDEELLPWLDAHVDLEQWFTRWGINLLLNIDDFAGHNYYLLLPGGEGGKWQMLGYDFDSLGRLIAGNLGLTYGDGRSGSPAWQRNKLYQRVAANPTLRRVHLLNLRRMLDTFFKESVLFPIVDGQFERSEAERDLVGGTAAGHVKTQIRGQRERFVRLLAAEELPGADAVPRLTPPGGQFAEAVGVAITVPEGWTAYFTTDGGDPRLSSQRSLYREPFMIASSTTLRVAGLRGTPPQADPASGDWTDVVSSNFELAVEGEQFIRGDFNLDGRLNTVDAVRILQHLFHDAAVSCRAAGDSNRDERLDSADAVFLLEYLFRRGPPPPAPFPEPGVDPREASGLGCEAGLEA